MVRANFRFRKPSVNLSACKLNYNKLQCFGRLCLVTLDTEITMSKPFLCL